LIFGVVLPPHLPRFLRILRGSAAASSIPRGRGCGQRRGGGGRGGWRRGERVRWPAGQFYRRSASGLCVSSFYSSVFSLCGGLRRHDERDGDQIYAHSDRVHRGDILVVATLFYQITLGHSLLWILFPVGLIAVMIFVLRALGKQAEREFSGLSLKGVTVRM